MTPYWQPRIASLAAVFVLALAMSARAATRVAVLAEKEPTATAVAAMLEADLSSDGKIALVEREKVAAVLKEQELQAALAADGVANRVAVGKILQAEVLVILHQRQDPKPAVEIVVCQTRSGVRLLAQTVPVEGDGQAAVKAASAAAKGAVARCQESFSTIAAVPPLACNDLAFQYQHLGGAYAHLIEQSLLSRKSTLVVELAEAQALAKELAVGGQAAVNRPLPLYVLGEYTNKGIGDARRVTVKLTVKRGKDEIGSKTQADLEPSKVAAALRPMALALLDGPNAATQPAADPAAEIKELLARARVFEQLGQPNEALPLFEASLLLQDQGEGHRGAAQAILNQYRIARNYEARDTPEEQALRRDRVQEQMHPLLVAGVEYAEAYLRLNSKASNNFDLLLGYMPSERNVVAVDAAEAFLRVLKCKHDNGVHDRMLQYASNVVGHLPARDQRLDFARRIAPLATGQGDGGTYKWLLEVAAGHQDAPDLRALLATIVKSDNPLAAQAAKDLVTDLENHKWDPHEAEPRRSATAPTVTNAQVQVEFAKFGPVLPWGIASLGDKLDVFWAENQREVPATQGIWTATDSKLMHGPLNCLHDGKPCFDGKYVWMAGDNAKEAEVRMLDPATGTGWRMDASSGLPAAPIRYFVAAPLAPGLICAAASIGDQRANLRSWIGLLRFDGRSPAKTSFQLVLEARQAPTPAVESLDKDVAFRPWAAHVLHVPIAGDPTSSDRQVVLFTVSGGTRYHNVAVEVRGTKATLLERPNQDNVLRAACLSHDEHGDALYWVGRRDLKTPHQSLFRIRDPMQPSEVVAEDVLGVSDTAALGVLGKRVYLYVINKRSLLYADLPEPKFRAVPTQTDPAMENFVVICGNPGPFTPTNHFGLIVCTAERALRFTDSRGEALTETSTFDSTTQPMGAQTAPARVPLAPGQLKYR